MPPWELHTITFDSCNLGAAVRKVEIVRSFGDDYEECKAAESNPNVANYGSDAQVWLRCLPRTLPTTDPELEQLIVELKANLDASLAREAKLKAFLRAGDVDCSGATASTDAAYVAQRFQNVQPVPPLSAACKGVTP